MAPTGTELLDGVATTVTEAGYRDLMSCFPTGISVVTTVDGQDVPHGMTCSSIASVTLRPPTLLVCLYLRAATLAAVRERGAFAVNLLHARAKSTAVLFGAPVPDRFGRIRWAKGPSGLPWLTGDAFAVCDCHVSGEVEVGDHAVVFGEVRRVRNTADTPLLYGLRTYSAWASPRCAAGEDGTGEAHPSCMAG